MPGALLTSGAEVERTGRSLAELDSRARDYVSQVLVYHLSIIAQHPHGVGPTLYCTPELHIQASPCERWTPGARPSSIACAGTPCRPPGTAGYLCYHSGDQSVGCAVTAAGALVALYTALLIFAWCSYSKLPPQVSVARFIYIAVVKSPWFSFVVHSLLTVALVPKCLNVQCLPSTGKRAI
jgi:hypothetical protein